MARKQITERTTRAESNTAEHIEPWQQTVNRVVLDYESKQETRNECRRNNNYMDVGKENRYMMWARLDMAAYEKVIRYCCKLDLDVDRVINHIIRFALDYYGEEGGNQYQEYVEYIHGRNQEYTPLLINAEDIDNYFSFIASKFGLTYE